MDLNVKMPYELRIPNINGSLYEVLVQWHSPCTAAGVNF